MSAAHSLVAYRCESCGARFEISRHSLAHAIAQSPKGRVLCPVDQKPLVEVTS